MKLKEEGKFLVKLTDGTLLTPCVSTFDKSKRKLAALLLFVEAMAPVLSCGFSGLQCTSVNFVISSGNKGLGESVGCSRRWGAFIVAGLHMRCCGSQHFPGFGK